MQRGIACRKPWSLFTGLAWARRLARYADQPRARRKRKVSWDPSECASARRLHGRLDERAPWLPLRLQPLGRLSEDAPLGRGKNPAQGADRNESRPGPRNTAQAEDLISKLDRPDLAVGRGKDRTASISAAAYRDEMSAGPCHAPEKRRRAGYLDRPRLAVRRREDGPVGAHGYEP